MSPEIGHRSRRNPAGWSRIFVFMFFATVYYATIIDITPVPGQSSSNNATVGVNVAKFLDFNRANVVRQVEPSCVEMAISDLYGWQPNYTAGLLINTRDSRRVEVVQAAASASYCNKHVAVPNNMQVQAILGPETSIQANFLIPLREKAQVSMTSFCKSSPTVASIGSPYIFRATQNDSTQVKATAAKDRTNSSTSRESLGKVIWPGDQAIAPKGFEIPTSRKKLRIGVPMKDGFSDPETNKTSLIGYSIDTFEAVVQTLRYALPSEYDDLVYQVFLGHFDAAVADTAIVPANRSMYIYFSSPYPESGVTMVVPAKPNGSKNPWLFLRPFTWDLWVIVCFLFLSIGFVVWVLEHRMISKDFRGPPSHQVGTTLWFSFSTMVFAHPEKVPTNLTRRVVIICCLVVLIIIGSYMASFTSTLTVQQLQPTEPDMNELQRKGKSVGYQNALQKRLGFRDDRHNDNFVDCATIFRRGRIVAAFNEVPLIKLFLAKHCPKYMIDRVLPIRSPLVLHSSRALLNIVERKEMTKIEEARIRKQRRSKESNTWVSSENQLRLSSFWGLFLITGVATLSSLCIFAAVTIYKHRKLLVPKEDVSQSSPSFWRRILNPFRICYRINPKCHNCRDDRVGNEVHLANMNAMSPSMVSVRTEFPVDSPQSPTPLMESLWIQPTDLLR